MYVMGITPASVRTSAQGPEFKLGTLGAVVNQSTLYTAPMSDTGTTAGADVGPKVFVYVKSTNGVTGAGYAVQIDASNDATMTASTSGFGNRVGIAQAAIAAGGYGWVQVYGPCVIRTNAADTAANARLVVTATAGALDDATGSGLNYIDGAILTTAASSSAGNFAGHLNWPTVGAESA